MVQNCIFCFESKPIHEFNEEHIFPSALGGAIVISNVCEECNGNLGRLIDQPFLNHPAVLYYRNIYDLSRNENRRKGLIPNPIKQTHTDKHGNRYRVEFRNSQPHAEIIESFTIEKNPETNEFMGKITISEDNIEDIDSIVKKHARRKGFELTEYKITSKQINHREAFTVTVDTDNNKFIFGCIKIAYEIIMNLFPHYHNDSLSKLIRQSIASITLHRRYKKLQDRRNLELMKRYDSIFKNIKGIEPIHHAVVIENIKGVGLVCCVRVFNWFYPVIMSLNAKLIKEGEAIFIYNDALKRKYASNVFYLNSNIKLTVDLEDLSEATKELIDKEKGKLFCNSEGLIAIYNKEEKVVYQDPNKLCDDKIKKLENYKGWLNESFDLNLSAENLYLKTIDGIRIKLLGIAFEREIILQRMV